MNLNNETSIEELLNNHFSQKKYQNLRCKKCLNPYINDDEYFIEKLPDFFVLAIERYKYEPDSDLFTKKKNKLNLNKKINFGSFTKDKKKGKFKLKSIIEHLGETLESGHAIR